MKKRKHSRWLIVLSGAVLLPANLLGQQGSNTGGAGSSANSPCHVDQQTLKLEYRDDKPTTPKPIRGGSLVGAMNGVAEAIAGAGAGDSKPADSTSAIKVDAYLNQEPGKPPTLSLKAEEMGSQNDPKVNGATRSALDREKKLLMDNLKKFSYQLSDADMQKLSETGELPIDISDKLGGLKKWGKPNLKLRVSGNCSPSKGPATAGLTDPKTGITTTSVDNPDGSRTVTRTDRDGKVLSTEVVPAKSAATASSTDTKTGITTTSVDNPDGSRTVTRTDRDGKVLSTEIVPAKGAGPTIASSTDPETGITTTSIGNPDGSHTVTRTDRDGKVLSTEMTPPKGSGLAIASSTDPKTGITTTSSRAPDGSHIVTTSQTTDEPDGSKRITSTDDNGNRTETRVSKDGSTTVTQTTPRGDTVTTSRTPDGKVTVEEKTAEGGKTVTQRDANGETVTEKFDAGGNRTEKVTRTADGGETREDNHGNVTKVTSNEQGTTETTTDRHGNTETVTRDSSGEVVSRTENQVTPKEPGQRYFETVLKGDDWDSLPQSLKNRYAGSEKAIRDTQEIRDLQQAQEADRVRVEEEQKKFSAELQAKTDAKLGEIQKEKEAADRKAAEQAARENRAREIQESYNTAARLEKEYSEAVGRGDKAEAKRISDLQDKHHEASMSLLEFNDEEKRAMESKQAARDRIYSEVVASARAAAQTRVDQDWQQGLKEDITAGTKYISVGSGVQQDLKKSTREADYQAAFAETKNELLERRYNDPKTTNEEREVIRDMMELAEVQREGAYEQLASNRNLTMAGYAVDVAMIAAGGPITKGLGSLLGKVGQRSVGELAGTATLGAVQRVAGKEAAQSLAAHSAAASATARAAVSRVTDSAVGKILSTDVATGAVAESRWLTQVAQNTARDTAIGAGAQLALTGEINLHDLALGAAAGGLVNGVIVGVRGTAPHPDARPPLARPQAETALPPRTAPNPAAETNALGQTAGVSREVPAAPASAPRTSQATATGDTVPSSTTQSSGTSQQSTSSAGKPVREPVNQTAAGKPAVPNEPASTSARGEPAAPVRTSEPGQGAASDRQPNQPAVADTNRAPVSGEPVNPANRGPEQPDTLPSRDTTATAQKPPAESVPAANANAQAEKPRIVRPGDPDFHPQQAAAAPPRPVQGQPVRPQSPDTLTQPKPNNLAMAAAEPRKYDPNAGTDIGGWPTNHNPTTPARVRELVPSNAREQFDQGMAVVDRLVQQDPRFANVDRGRVAEQMAVRAGVMEPEAAAALALNYQAPNGARVTPEALANATGIPRAQAETAVRAGWDAVKYNPVDINNPSAPANAVRPNPPGPPGPPDPGPPPAGASEAKTHPLPQREVVPNKPAEAPPASRPNDENAFAANNRQPSEVPNQEKPATASNEPLKVDEFDPNAPEPEAPSKPNTEESKPTGDASSAAAPTPPAGGNFPKPRPLEARSGWVPEKGAYIDDLLKKNYGNQKQPPMHMTNRASLEGIKKSGILEAPISGASWSYSGSVREGNVAIRLTPDGQKFVVMNSAEVPTGLVPKYYPQGVGKDGKGIGQFKTYVPSKYLEYYDWNSESWLPVKE